MIYLVTFLTDSHDNNYHSDEPFANGSRPVTQDEWLRLQNQLKNYHSPIQELLETTNIEDVSVCDAVSSKHLDKS
jgi:hypothetical protein